MERLLKYCESDRQRKIVHACIEHTTKREAANQVGIAERNVFKCLKLLRAKAALAGECPERDLNYPLPYGQQIKGTSTLIDKKTGESRLQWVKTDVDAETKAEIQRQAIKALKSELPAYQPVAFKATTVSDLATVYTLTDCHVGMRSWAQETGADWDLDIAERVLTETFQALVLSSPHSETAVVAQLGDFLHADNINPVTPTSGHLLDADGRYSKVVQVAIRILRQVIRTALSKHKKVIVLMAEGNHDLSSSIWLREMFKAVYEREPRVTVIDTPLPYYVYQHGNVMLSWHHGHLRKNDQLPLLFAAQFPGIWGETTKRYVHTGHRHHTEEKEHSGMTVVQHPTLAAMDAYAARGGWIAERRAVAITYHKSFGEVSRVSVLPEMTMTKKGKNVPKKGKK